MGGWGCNWAATIIPEVREVKLVGCVDTNPASLRRAQELAHIPADICFKTLSEALEAVDVNAVLVTVSLPAHAAVARAALEAGKHVLLEKPFVETPEEALQLASLAKDRGLLLMISQNYRFFPAPQAAMTLIREQVLGKPGTVYVDFRWYNNNAPRGSNPYYAVPQPLLVDMSIHHFDLMRAVLDQEPRTVSCNVWNPPWSRYSGPPCANVTIEFDGGTTVAYRGSWVSTGPRTNWAGEWRMECERGDILWTSRGPGDSPDVDRVVVRPMGKAEREIPLPAISRTDRAGTLTEFATALQTGKQPVCTAEDNARSIAIMSAAVESSTVGHPIRLNL